jgi:septin family protein
MKKLSEVVNVVPVIAKADSLTLDERDAFKLKVCFLFCFPAMKYGLTVQ